MSNISMNVTDTRIAAVYASHDALLQAKAVIMRKLGLHERKVKVIPPNQNDVSAELEGKASKVKSEIWTLHVIWGLLGFMAGMVLALYLTTDGPQWARENVIYTYIALVSPGLFIGLFIAGFLSLKPQRDMVNQEATKGTQNNQWTLIVDTADSSVERDDVIEQLEQTEVKELTK